MLGFHSEFVMDTRGEGILDHSFYRYEPYKGEIPMRRKGAIISGETGKTVAYALWKLQERGCLFLGPQVDVYEGMIIGENAKEDDLVVNSSKEKKQSNVRASGSDEAIRLVPPAILTLEQSLEFINDGELVEITPKNVRIRKKFLTESDRKRASRNA